MTLRVPPFAARACTLGALALGLLTAPAPAVAQEHRPRPQLPAGALLNDWEAYFDLGLALFRRDAALAGDAFYWAARLDPSRAEPIFGLWATFWMSEHPDTWLQYLRGNARVRSRADVQAADSLRELAVARNPFVHRGLEIVLYDRLPGRWRDNAEIRAWHAYAEGDLQRSADLLAREIRRSPERNRWMRYDRALALGASGRFAEAAQELTQLLERLRHQDERELVRTYASKHQLLYMIGLLRQELRQREEARLAYEEALVEHAGYAPVYAALGTLARQQRQGSAGAHFAMAAELAPNDGWIRFQHGQFLFDSGRLDEARVELQEVTRLEPFFALPHLLLGRLHQRQGRHSEALTHLRTFLDLASAADSQRAPAGRLINLLLDHGGG